MHEIDDLRRQFFKKGDELRRLADDVAALRDRAFPIGSQIRLRRCPSRQTTVESHWTPGVKFPTTILGGTSKGRWRENADLLDEVSREPTDE